MNILTIKVRVVSSSSPSESHAVFSVQSFFSSTNKVTRRDTHGGPVIEGKTRWDEIPVSDNFIF